LAIILETGLSAQAKPAIVSPQSMDQAKVPSRPLCVDLDGTLLETDTTKELIFSFLRAKLWRCGELLFWWMQGRAHLKRRLAEDAVLGVEKLPVHPDFLQFLKEQHAAGRTLVLVSASDEQTVRRVAERFKLFAETIGSDGKTNLRGHAKVSHLIKLYGEKGFDYAGNSSVDYPVWQGAAEAIVVNARPVVEQHARKIANVTRVFPRR
jgi:phosphoserine phosphatase